MFDQWVYLVKVCDLWLSHMELTVEDKVIS